MKTRAGLDRDIILQAAIHLVDRDGLTQLTMATLAAHLQVRPPTLYHYFDGLAAIRRSLALRGLSDISHRLGLAVMGLSGDDAVISLISALCNFAREHPGLYDATTRATDAQDAEWQAAGLVAVDIGIRALSAYHLSYENALHMIRIIRSIIHGWVALNNAGGFALDLDRDETFRHLINVILLYLHTCTPHTNTPQNQAEAAP